MLLFLYPLEKIGIPYIVSTFIVKWKPTGTNNHTLWRACIALTISFALITFLWSLLYYVELSMQQHLWMGTKDKMVREVFSLYEKDNHEMPLGRWLTHIENVPILLEQIFYKMVCYIIPELIGIVVVFFYFAYIDLWLGVGSMVFAGLFVLYFLLNIRGSQSLARDEYAKQTNFNQKIHNTIDNLAYIQTAQSQKFELGRFVKDTSDFMQTKRHFCWRNSWFLAGMDVIIYAYIIFVVLWSYRRMTEKNISPAKLGLYASVFVVLLAEARDLDNIKGLVTELYNYTYKSQVFLQEKHQTNTSSSPKPSSPTAHRRQGPCTFPHPHQRLSPNATSYPQDMFRSSAISTRALTFSYPGAQRPVVNKLTLGFAPNKLHAIEGPAGCGKSTFAKMLAGIHKSPQSGNIYLFGNDVTTNVDTRRRAVVYLPQHVKLFEGSILENIRYTRTDLSEDQVHNLLELLEVDSVLQNNTHNTHPDHHYLKRPVGVNGSGVSGGQKQVIMLVRTCVDVGAISWLPPKPHGSATETGTSYFHKSILVFDEPTASLDPDMVNVVVKLLKRLSVMRTVLVITHDTRVASACDTRVTFTR